MVFIPPSSTWGCPNISVKQRLVKQIFVSHHPPHQAPCDATKFYVRRDMFVSLGIYLHLEKLNKFFVSVRRFLTCQNRWSGVDLSYLHITAELKRKSVCG